MYEFDWSSIPGALPFLWQGMKVSLAITGIAIAAGIAWGTVLAVLRLSPVTPLSFFAASYVIWELLALGRVSLPLGSQYAASIRRWGPVS